MGYHHVKYAAFGVGTEGPARLEAALARAGRRVLGREPLPLDGRNWPVVEGDTLTMFVWKLELPEDSILWVEEYPRDREEGTFHRFREQFDMVLLRALSAETDGFVIGYDMLNSATQDGTAVFFAGRTLEAALMASGSMVADPCIGLRSLEDLGTSVDLAFRRRLADLHGGASLTLEPEGEMLLAESWRVTPRTAPFELEPESAARVPAVRAVMPYVGEEGLAAARELLPPDARLRISRLGVGPWPVLEIAFEGEPDLDAFEALSRRLSAWVVLSTIEGGDGENGWIQLVDGACITGHKKPGADVVIEGFGIASRRLALAPTALRLAASVPAPRSASRAGPPLRRTSFVPPARRPGVARDGNRAPAADSLPHPSGAAPRRRAPDRPSEGRPPAPPASAAVSGSLGA